MADVKPAYEVERLEGKLERTFSTIEYVDHEMGLDTDGEPVTKKVPRRKLVTKKVDAGFMVYTAKRDSFHVWDEADLIRKGINPAGGPLLDMDTGEQVGMQPSLRDQVRYRGMRST